MTDARGAAPARPARPRVLGLGTATPGNRVPQAVLAEAAAACCSPRVARVLPRLYARSGVGRRGCCVFPEPADGAPQSDLVAAVRGVFPPPTADRPAGPGVDERMAMYRAAAPPLAADAARAALADAGTDPAVIDHLVTVSCTGFAAPGVDLALFGRLGLGPATTRTHVGFMGCHGAMNGLRVASALAAADPGCRVLLVCVEICTAHFRYGDDGLTANALFGDGAAAAVVGAAPAGSFPPAALAVVDQTSLVLPDSADAMTWSIGSHGFEMTLSPAVPALIAERLPGVLVPWLVANGLTPADVAGWAVHPGGPRVLDAVEATLGLPADALAASRRLLFDHGNMSSPTVLFLLERLRAESAGGPRVALAFGPGLAAEAALLG